MLPAAPVLPEHRSCPNAEGMQEQTHSARLRRRRPVPLTPLAQLTAPTVSNPGSEKDPQCTIRFSALLGRTKRLTRRTAQRTIRLRSKVVPGEPPGFPRRSCLGRRVANGASRTHSRLYNSRSEFGGAQGSRLQLMPQLQAEVPHPLRNDLPAFLPAGGVRTPAVGILFLILIG